VQRASKNKFALEAQEEPLREETEAWRPFSYFQTVLQVPALEA